MRELRRLRPPSGRRRGWTCRWVGAAVPPSGAPKRSGFQRVVSFRASDLSGEAPFPGVPPQLSAHTSICDSPPKSKLPPLPGGFARTPPSLPDKNRNSQFGTSLHLPRRSLVSTSNNRRRQLCKWLLGCGDSLVRGASKCRRADGSERRHDTTASRELSAGGGRSGVHAALLKNNKSRFFSVPTTFPPF